MPHYSPRCGLSIVAPERLEECGDPDLVSSDLLVPSVAATKTPSLFRKHVDLDSTRGSPALPTAADLPVPARFRNGHRARAGCGLRTDRNLPIVSPTGRLSGLGSCPRFCHGMA